MNFYAMYSYAFFHPFITQRHGLTNINALIFSPPNSRAIIAISDCDSKYKHNLGRNTVHKRSMSPSNATGIHIMQRYYFGFWIPRAQAGMALGIAKYHQENITVFFFFSLRQSTK